MGPSLSLEASGAQTIHLVNTPSTIGLVVGITVTPIVAVLALASAGGGHGDYRLCIALFPLLTIGMFTVLGAFAIPLALAQYPFFGWYIGRCIARKQFIRMAVVILLLQIIPMVYFLARA